MATSAPYCPWQVGRIAADPRTGQTGTTMPFTLFATPGWRWPGTASPGCPSATRSAPSSSSRAGARRPRRRPAAPAALAVDRRHRDGLLGRSPNSPPTAASTATGWRWRSPSRCEPYRGYGPGAVTILRLIRTGTPWPVAAASAFDGQGSCGNGAAMRVAPLGAWYADSTAARGPGPAPPPRSPTPIRRGSPARSRWPSPPRSPPGPGWTGERRPADRLLAAVAGAIDPAAEVHRGIRRAVGLLGRPLAEAVAALGNGSRVTAQDTVAVHPLGGRHPPRRLPGRDPCLRRGGRGRRHHRRDRRRDRRRHTPGSARPAGCPTTGSPPGSRCRTGWADGQAGRGQPACGGLAAVDVTPDRR